MDLNRTSTFVRVVETGGFTRAAEALGLPASSVSRSVARLEQDLGITLLERTTRKVTLTEAGRAFFERAREALAGLEEANALALDSAREAHGVVRVAVPPDFGGVMGMVFAAFMANNPRVRVEVAFTARGAELVGDLVDLAVVIGKLPDSSLVSRKLGQATERLFASPGYLSVRGRPRTVADLAKHDVILQRASGGEARWELLGPKGVERAQVKARLVGDHIELVTEAAIAGLGIALLPSFVGDPAVANNQLARVLPKHGVETALQVVSHGARHLPRRVALLRDHLVEALSSGCTAHHGKEAVPARELEHADGPPQQPRSSSPENAT